MFGVIVIKNACVSFIRGWRLVAHFLYATLLQIRCDVNAYFRYFRRILDTCWPIFSELFFVLKHAYFCITTFEPAHSARLWLSDQLSLLVDLNGHRPHVDVDAPYCARPGVGCDGVG